MYDRMKRFLVLVVGFAALTAAATALAGSNAATSALLVGVTSPARRNAEAAPIAHVVPARRCTIAVLYGSGPSHAQGLGPKRPTHGYVTWKWQVGGNTTLGIWPIQVNCGSAGSFRTHFRVIRYQALRVPERWPK
jgi:micrococcal nuclease